MVSSEQLAVEFQQYLTALQPDQCARDMLPASTFAEEFRNTYPVVGKGFWKRAECRDGFVRDFKTFAVNYIQNGLEVRPGPVEFAPEETEALRLTADVWSKSVC